MRYQKISAVIVLALMIVVCMAQAFAAESSTSGLEKEEAITLSLVNQDPDPAIAGDTLDIRIGVVNLGGVAAENHVVEVVPSYPFEIVPGESATQEIGLVNAYQGTYSDNSQIVKFKIRVNKDATAGSYLLKVLNYEKDSSVKTQSSFSVDVKSQENAEIIHIDKTVVVPGEETLLKFTINNVGNAPLRDLTFYWENTDEIILPVGSDNTKYVKYIEVGKSAEVEYKVIADTNADPGLYKLNLYLKYDDPLSDEEKTISTIAGVYIGGGTNFEVSFSESSGSEMTFTVANVGSNEAYSVSVIIPEQTGWSVSGSNSAIIGNLDKGDYTVASFTLQQNSGMAALSAQTGAGARNASAGSSAGNGAYPRAMNSSSSSGSLLVRIAYTDTMGQRKSVDKTVAMSTSSSNSTASAAGGMYGNFPGARRRSAPIGTYALYILGVLVLIGAFLTVRKYRSEKLVNPKYRLVDVFKGLFKKKEKKATAKNQM